MSHWLTHHLNRLVVDELNVIIIELYVLNDELLRLYSVSSHTYV